MYAPEALGCRLQNVPLGKNQLSLRISQEDRREGEREEGGREGVVSEQTELLNCAAQMKAAGH